PAPAFPHSVSSHASCHPHHLPSFPTRRSSDLTLRNKACTGVSPAATAAVPKARPAMPTATPTPRLSRTAGERNAEKGFTSVTLGSLGQRSCVRSGWSRHKRAVRSRTTPENTHTACAPGTAFHSGAHGAGVFHVFQAMAPSPTWPYRACRGFAHTWAVRTAPCASRAEAAGAILEPG